MLGETTFEEMVAKIHALVPPRLKPLDMKAATLQKCGMTGRTYYLDPLVSGGFASFEGESCGEMLIDEASKDQALQAIEDHRNEILKQHLL